MNKQEVIDKLNIIISQENACAIRYATHASVLTGPNVEPIRARLFEISHDELDHAKRLRDRVVALGGKPTLEVRSEDLTPAYDLETILKVNMREELDAINAYSEVLKLIPEDNVILYETIRDLIRDEQDHLEELSRLLG